MSDDHWEQFGPGAVGIGWDLGLVGLSVHLRTGEPLEPGQGNRWAASEEGRRFMAPASEAWCRANIVSGEDSQVARAAADRGSQAYLAVP